MLVKLTDTKNKPIYLDTRQVVAVRHQDDRLTQVLTTAGPSDRGSAVVVQGFVEEIAETLIGAERDRTRAAPGS